MFLTTATENALEVMHQQNNTITTLLAICGVVAIISLLIMSMAVTFRYKLAKLRPIEDWKPAERQVTLLFLESWMAWSDHQRVKMATPPPFPYHPEEALIPAFCRFIVEGMPNNVDKHFDCTRLVKEMLEDAGLPNQLPFGHDDDVSTANNLQRRLFVRRYIQVLKHHQTLG